MSNFKIGHLIKSNEAKINNIPISEGTIIYSENSGTQFVDYAGKRHSYASVISGVHNGTSYVDFSTVTLDQTLTAIKAYGLLNDGQLINANNSIYRYRKINNKNFIVKLDESSVLVDASKVGFIINIPEFTSGDLVDMELVVSVSNETNGDKLFFVVVNDNELILDSCEDVDGTFDSSTFNITLTHIGDGLFSIKATTQSTIKVISYNSSSKSEGLYVVACDI